jgi:hypothetical protein
MIHDPNAYSLKLLHLILTFTTEALSQVLGQRLTGNDTIATGHVPVWDSRTPVVEVFAVATLPLKSVGFRCDPRVLTLSFAIVGAGTVLGDGHVGYRATQS